MRAGKQQKHLKRLKELKAERDKARRASNASVVTSRNDCKSNNEAVDPLPQASSSSTETSKCVKEEVHGEDVTVTNDEDGVPPTTTPDKNEDGEQLADMEEVSIPVKQLKIHQKARVIDKPKPKRLLHLKPRPPFPSPSFCFVCVTPVYRPSGTISNITKADCSFLIKEMLELSKMESDHYLARLKDPETLIGLCVNCLEVVREAIKLREQISELEMSLKTYQRQIVKTMKGTELTSFTGVNINPMGGRKEHRVTIENMLRLVYKRKHSSLLSSRDSVGKRKAPQSGLDVIKETVTMATTSAPDHDIDAIRNHPVTRVQKKSKTIQPRKTIRIITTSGPTKKMYLVRPKSTPKPLGGKQLSAGLLRPSSSEVPILNFNHCKDLSKDPLALDDEFENMFWPDPPDQKPEKIESAPEIHEPPVLSSPLPAPVRYLICGLCKDDKIYESGAQLQLHTNKMHQQLNPEPPQEVIPLSKSSEGPGTMSLRVEGKKGGRIIKGRNIMVYPTRTKPPVKTYSRKQPPATSGNLEGNIAKRNDMGFSEKPRNALHEITKWSAYDCPLCPAVKDYGLNIFIQHLAIHQRRPYRCTVCSELFPEDEAIREEHWKDKHSSAPIPPSSTPLDSPEKFVKLQLTPGQIWKCDGCPSAFITEEGRDNHELRCSMLQEKSLSMSKMCSIPRQCSTCKKVSRSMEEWRLHRALYHLEVNQMCCTYCDKSFAEKTVEGVEVRRDHKMVEHILKDHRIEGLSVTRPFDECESCGVVFKLAAEAEAHFLDVHGIPSGGRIFTCPICHVRLASKSYLPSHIKRCHFKELSLVCDICGVDISDSLKMVEHKLQKHGILPEGRNLHVCPEKDCEFKSAIKRVMDHHAQSAHGVARKYTCKHCGKGFMVSTDLRRHELIHENKGKKPYQCEICGNSFAIRNYLYIHKRLSHEGRTFPSTNRKRVSRPQNEDSN